MKYHLFQFKDYVNLNKTVHDIYNIYLKKDPDFIIHEDQSLHDVITFIDNNFNNPELGLVIYAQDQYCRNEAEIIEYINHYETYNGSKIQMKIIIFSFDWWFRGDKHWVSYCKSLFQAKNHYTVTFCNNLGDLERLHQEKYKDYISNIIFYNIWGCYENSFIPFNENPIPVVGLAGTVNLRYPTRRTIYKLILDGYKTFAIVPFDINEILNRPDDQNDIFTRRLNKYLCIFASPIHCFHFRDQFDDETRNTHIIIQKYYEILASGALLLCPKTEEKTLNEIGLYSGINCLMCDMNKIIPISHWIVNPRNRKQVDTMRKRGQQLAIDRFKTYHKYLWLKKEFNRRFGMGQKIYKDNTIDDSVIIHQNVSIGKNNIIKKGVVIRSNTIIGDNNIILENNQIGVLSDDNCEEFQNQCLTNREKGGVIIGDNNNLDQGNKIFAGLDRTTRIGNSCQIGKNNEIGQDALLHNNIVIRDKVFIGSSVEFYDNVIIDSGSIIRNNIKIGPLRL